MTSLYITSVLPIYLEAPAYASKEAKIIGAINHWAILDLVIQHRIASRAQ
ncbi:hypothetical protein LZ641_15950 [Hafnia paralvei]|nr:hypothetical protein [Hafnia paralvei]MCE9881811.1 hypothetical protein [Hafnia paralvei]MCE9903942.1 hypothetical protein [Hafnia paralvei]MCE9908125.1 hypothetical protein [Hafnia paralvei]MCE9949903.1 hypothetical protein [Hafnia paralvei]